MVEVAPLRAWEYDPARVDVSQVISPPFDVIGDAQLKDLRKRSPHNVVHLTLGSGKGKQADRFRQAQRLLEKWISEGVLREGPNAIYAYQCEYAHAETPRRLRGLLLRLRLDPNYKSVLPHEEIFGGPTMERIKLLRATGWDLEPIELLYSGQNVETALWAYLDGTGRPPDLMASFEGAVHRFWRVTDPAVMATVQDGLKGRKLIIADGHHRYAAACKYAEERRRREYRPPRDAPWEYKLSLLVHLDDPGLLILPTHRVVKRARVKDPRELVATWSSSFLVRNVDVDDSAPLAGLLRHMQAEAAKGYRALGAWMGQPPRAFLIEPKDKAVPEAVALGKSLAWRGLDVVYLQKLLLEGGMKVPASRWGQDVTYTRNDREAEDWIRRRRAVAVLAHLPTRLAQLRAVVESGERMPQKSTYFLPKVISGALFHRIGKPQGPPSKPRITS